MREIRENTYVFSSSSESFGRIIAHRSRNGDGCDDVIARLGLNKEDARLIADLNGSSVPNVILLGNRDGRESLVVVLRGLAYEASLCIAVEVYDKPYEVLSMLYAPDHDDFICSRAVNELVLKGTACGFDTSALATVRYILELIALCGVDLGSASNPTLAAIDVLEAVADLVGVRLDVDRTGYGSRISESGAFFNKLCISALICFAMDARAGSLDRLLYAKLSSESDRLTISLEYSPFGDTKCLGGEFISSIAEAYGIPSLLLCDNRAVRLVLAPQCSDIGLVGVKNPLVGF